MLEALLTIGLAIIVMLWFVIRRLEEIRDHLKQNDERARQRTIQHDRDMQPFRISHLDLELMLSKLADDLRPERVEERRRRREAKMRGEPGDDAR